MRCNASTRGHAELDEAKELDEGHPATLATAQDRIAGGCCGTDARHVAALWHVDQSARV